MVKIQVIISITRVRITPGRPRQAEETMFTTVNGMPKDKKIEDTFKKQNAIIPTNMLFM